LKRREGGREGGRRIVISMPEALNCVEGCKQKIPSEKVFDVTWSQASAEFTILLLLLTPNSGHLAVINRHEKKSRSEEKKLSLRREKNRSEKGYVLI
jgi:hypothetical protein